ncbi:hypothetical protein [Brevundimonas diminuta]|uniref:hypothetical protein n=1 Tax=Brevundimonas diminuta TaxID=293 RepID=UPI003F814DB9
MKFLGWALFALGAVLLMVGGFSDASVPAGSAYPSYLSNRVMNNGLMFWALKMMLAGGFMLVSGATLLARSSVPATPSVPAAPVPTPPEHQLSGDGTIVAPERTEELSLALERRNAESAKADRLTAIAIGFVILVIVISVALVIGDYVSTR